jgi:hypothetical protein
MGVVRVSAIDNLYTNALCALKLGIAAAKEAIEAAINAFLNYLDGGLVGAVVKWAIGKVFDACVDLEAKALSIALRCEYVYRAGKVSFDSARKAWNLTNKCSKCRCIGHNKQNHSSDIDDFLMSNQLMSYVGDAQDLVGATEEDGWWSWLTG